MRPYTWNNCETKILKKWKHDIVHNTFCCSTFSVVFIAVLCLIPQLRLLTEERESCYCVLNNKQLTYHGNQLDLFLCCQSCVKMYIAMDVFKTIYYWNYVVLKTFFNKNKNIDQTLAPLINVLVFSYYSISTACKKALGWLSFYLSRIVFLRIEGNLKDNHSSEIR